jgi:hypothetical protein
LHPQLFGTPDMAESEFRRAGFNRQNPGDHTYREMTVKSARYRRAGRGRSWQRVWWPDGAEGDVHAELSSRLGQIDGWENVV